MLTPLVTTHLPLIDIPGAPAPIVLPRPPAERQGYSLPVVRETPRPAADPIAFASTW